MCILVFSTSDNILELIECIHPYRVLLATALLVHLNSLLCVAGETKTKNTHATQPLVYMFIWL